jgi:methyl-accepting chemotaxis protein
MGASCSKSDKVVEAVEVRAANAHAKAQDILDKYSTTIRWVDGGLAVVANVPGFGGACASLRALLGSVEKGGELAQDVLDTVEAVLDAVEHLRQIKKAVVRASAAVKAQLDRDMAKVKKIIDTIRDTVENMPKGWWQAGKTANKLQRLAAKLEKALASIERTLQLETFRMAVEGFSASVKDLTELIEKRKPKRKRKSRRVAPLKPLGHGAEQRQILKQHRAAVWAQEYYAPAKLRVLPRIGH